MRLDRTLSARRKRIHFPSRSQVGTSELHWRGKGLISELINALQGQAAMGHQFRSKSPSKCTKSMDELAEVFHMIAVPRSDSPDFMF